MTNGDTDLAAAINTVIRMEMTGQGVTQKDLAAKLGMERAALTRNLTGKTDMKFTTLVKIAQALDLDIEDLVHRAKQRLR